jgi:predicted class III extradiol MEMO1 family dioxygenase
MVDKLYASGPFEWMSQSVDEDEHSLEMHLPYIFKILSK